MSDETANTPLTVLVTIHGVGFQLSPADTDRGPNPAGYADVLHQHLTDELHGQLSADPERNDPRTGEPFGPVYVQSHWPPRADDENARRAGLARLDPDHALRVGDEPLGHVALVYSHLEETTPKPGSFLELCGQAIVQHGKYASMPRIARWLWSDWAAYRKPLAVPGARLPSPSLSPRPRTTATPNAAGGSGSGLSGSLRDTLVALENDFAAYVLRNDLRQRIRGFVEDVIVKIAQRPEVDAIVINAHSQGTAVAFDVISELADEPAKRLKHLVTSGSQLRKLVRLFNWGSAIGDMSTQLPWTNFFDACDPVADALGHDAWTPGQHLDSPTRSGPTLFATRPVTDIEVCNVEHTSGTGLRAHNYFDNVDQWIPTLVDIVRQTARIPGPLIPSVSPTMG